MPARPAAKARPSARQPPARVTGTLDQHVYDVLFDDLTRGTLKPGDRLAEEALCERFEVSRTVVRQALRRLAESHVVDIVPNKGATVAAPTPLESREVFQARRVIEAAIVRLVTQRIGASDLERLRRRLQAEHAALHDKDHRRWVDLAGGFHLALAHLCGNGVLQRMHGELMSRCSLIVALYETPGDASCEHDEHQRLVELLELRHAEGAALLMEQHLVALEARLRFPAPG
ncbi:MAG: GntR family transcriptional regulator [Burkholderiaceae bacterium]|nr:GntR family transcriptional regulator [Burkholderiaceae bacterium]